MLLNVSEVYIIALILLAIIGGIINTFQLINFMKQSQSRFLSSRNPQLIILYCIISLTTAFTTTPFTLYYHELPDLHPNHHVIFFAKFATEFFHEFCTIVLLVIILCRSWLLYYDYKFSESSSDEIWRNIVNSNEENFWIKHRKTLGNLHFIICVSLIVDSISLLALSLIGSYVLTQEDSKIFHYFSLFGLGIPFCSFIIYLIYNKIKIINDIYLIHQELKYLSICIIVRIVSFSFDLFLLNEYDNYLFFYTVEVITIFLSVWIQCRWVLVKLKEIEKEKDLDMYINFNSDERKKTGKNKNLLTMIDIFEQQTSFEIFIRHCNHELSVESVLFMIEISQFKATLFRYNAFGIEALNQRFLNSINTNFVKYFKEKRRAKMNKHIIIHPLYDDDTPSPSPSPSPLSPISSPSGKTDLNHHHQVRKIELKSDKQFFVASMKQESEYAHFQVTILDKKWLPLNKLLLDIKETEKSKTKSKTKSKDGSKGEDNTEKSKTKSKTKSRTKSGTNTQTKSGTAPTITGMTKTKSLSKTGSYNKFMSGSNNMSLSPISLAVINDNNNQNNNNNVEEKKEDSANSKTKSKSKSKENQSIFDKNMTVDIHWIYEYGKYLYDKYVDDSANLSINVSHAIRKDLWSVYSKRFSEEAFQKIQLLHHDYLSSITHLTGKEEQLFIQTYLYHSFDDAFHSVWCLLKSDTFYRFQKSKKYKELCQEADEEKIMQAKVLRDHEYSRSFKESQID